MNCSNMNNMCSNCHKYEVAKTQFCGYKDWCEQCDISLWSTRETTPASTIATTTTIKIDKSNNA
jgi:hypothetical protein